MEDNSVNYQQPESNSSKRIYLAIIAVLLLINGIAFYLLLTENKEKKEKIETITKMDNEAKDMNTQLETAKQELDGLKGKNTELDGIVAERQAAIEQIQGQLAAAQQRGKLSAADISKFKQQIAQLQVDNAQLQEKVKELAGKN